MAINWKYLLGAVALAFCLGFVTGVIHLQSKESGKAIAAEDQAKVIAEKVAAEVQTIKNVYDPKIDSLQSVADAAEARTAAAEARLAAYKKQPQSPAVPVPGPGVPTLPTITTPDELPSLQVGVIEAQKTQIAALKGLNASLYAENTLLKTTVTDLQQEVTLKKIALDAQIAANKSGKWVGRFQGVPVGIITDELVSLLAHRTR